MPEINNIAAWLDEEPPVTKQLANGALYIPIEQVLKDLDEYCKRCETITWSTQRFRDTYLRMNTAFVVSGSIELVLAERVLVGTATFTTTELNPHWASILKSLAITNAVMPLGRRFGRYLNEGLELFLEGTSAQEQAEDILTFAQYEKNKQDAAAKK